MRKLNIYSMQNYENITFTKFCKLLLAIFNEVNVYEKTQFNN